MYFILMANKLYSPGASPNNDKEICNFGKLKQLNTTSLFGWKPERKFLLSEGDNRQQEGTN